MKSSDITFIAGHSLQSHFVSGYEWCKWLRHYCFKKMVFQFNFMFSWIQCVQNPQEFIPIAFNLIRNIFIDLDILFSKHDVKCSNDEFFADDFF